MRYYSPGMTWLHVRTRYSSMGFTLVVVNTKHKRMKKKKRIHVQRAWRKS
jgi:hypothetical protein